MEGREWSYNRDKVTKRRRGKEGVEQGRGLGTIRALSGYLCRGSRVPSYATANGAGPPT